MSSTVVLRRIVLAMLLSSILVTLPALAQPGVGGVAPAAPQPAFWAAFDWLWQAFPWQWLQRTSGVVPRGARAKDATAPAGGTTLPVAPGGPGTGTPLNQLPTIDPNG